MPIELPARTGSPAPRRRAAPPPSAEDIPSQPVASDPGVNVPDFGKFATGGQEIGAAVTEVAGAYADIARRQSERDAAVDLADRVGTLNRDSDEELRRLSTEEDLSRTETLAAYGKFLAERRQQLLDEHRGTPDSRARLAIRLGALEDTYTGRAGALSTEIGRGKVETRIGDIVTPLTARVSNDPGGLDDAIQTFEAALDDYALALTPADEEILRRSGRAQLVESAIQSHLVRGDTEGAAGILDTAATTQKILDPATAGRIRLKITQARMAKNESTLQLEQFRILAGRDPTAAERTQIAMAPFTKSPLVSIGTDRFGPIPAGFMRSVDEDTGAVRDIPIPGSEAERDRVEAEQAAAARAQSKQTTDDVVIEDIGRAFTVMDEATFPTTGFTGGLLANIGGTSARDLSGLIDTIKANVGFDKLQQMREASPTGGALGQVSEMENRLLQSVLGNLELSQSEDQLRFNLRRLHNVYLDTVHGPGQGPPRVPLTQPGDGWKIRRVQ